MNPPTPSGPTFVVLAMHGMRPRDFPADEAAELARLHAELPHGSGPGHGHGGGGADDEPTRRLRALEAKLRAWPRTPENDPFHAASHRLAARLAEACGFEVLVGFNEFCAPTIAEAIDTAVAKGAARVLVTTTMLMRGGVHAEHDIPHEVRHAQERHPGVEVAYAWPFAETDVAAFLAMQLRDAEPARAGR